MLQAGFFARDVVEVAHDLVGARLLVDDVGGRIVETEAYDREDPASHSHAGPNARNASMFGPPGRAYVYRSYGIHWCLNVVCGAAAGGAVLIRAIEPEVGLERMRERRGLDDVRRLCAGPGRLCQALGVSRDHDGLPLDNPPFCIEPRSAAVEIAAGSRVGISRAVEVPWRFGLSGSRYLSRPMANAPADRPLHSAGRAR